MEQGGNKMKAILIKTAQLKAIAADPSEKAIFRQTKNWNLKRWSCVQRQGPDGTWGKIDNQHLVVNKMGWAFALWRMRTIMASKKDINLRPHWSVSIFKIKHGVYMTYYLVCKRIRYSIQGIY
jgi:hypothetical protein